MSREEYILAFESILYGLIISRILIKWNYMIQDDPPKKHYWAFWVFSISIFLLIIYVFIMNKVFTDHYNNIIDPKTFLFYAVFPPSLFTFIVYQMFPKEFKNIDLREYMMNNRSRILIPLILYILFNLFQFSGSIFDFGTIAGMIVILFSIAVIIFNRQWLIEIYTVLFAIITIIAGYL